MKATEESLGPHGVVVTMSFVEAIGVYKLALGIDDEDSRRASAALQVHVGAIVE